MPHLTIDGLPIEVPSGTTVLRAAEMHGITIPKLCDFEHLKPYGGCRLCVVEVDGARTLQTACTLPVSEGMVVRTDTPQVHEARRMVLAMLFSERNHFCMYCQVSGADCDLQNAALDEDMTHWPMQPAWNAYPVDASHPYFVLDNNRCILCRRCVRACGDLVGNHTLGIQARGAQALLVADTGVPLGESSCIRCGTCVQVCPTGALMERFSTYRGLRPQTEGVRSICVGCSVGCGVILRTRDNHLLRIESDWEAPVNRGLLCEDGRFQPLYRQQGERLSAPLVRSGDAQRAVAWEEALRLLAEALSAAEGRLAALISTRQPTESLAAFTRLFRERLRAAVVASIEEGRAAHPALEEALASGQRASLEDLRRADCVFVLGADLHRNHQVAGFFVRRNLPHAAQLILCGAPDTPLSAQAALRLPADDDGGVLRALVSGGGPEIRSAARMLSEARQAVFVIGRGFTARASAEDVQALLAAAGRFGARLLPLYGKANSRAAVNYGLQAPFETRGVQAACLFLGDDQPHPRLLERLEGVPFVAVQAAYASELTARADVVLPAALWTEQSGHYLNLEGRLQKAQAALQPPPGILSVQAALQQLAALLPAG